MGDLFSMKGRFNRSRYILTTLAITAVTYGVAFVIGVMTGVMGMGENVATLAGGVVGVFANIIVAFVVVKRLHDLDRPGWHFWLLLVPLYNIYLGCVMLFVRGTQGSNQYGNDTVTT